MTQLLSRRIGLQINEMAALRQKNRLTIVNHLKKGKIRGFYLSESEKRLINEDHCAGMPTWMTLTQAEVATLWSCSRSHVAVLLGKPEGDCFRLTRTEGKVTYGDVLAFMERNRLQVEHLA
ncbi:hypothetical protein [Rufibacter soli]